MHSNAAVYSMHLFGDLTSATVAAGPVDDAGRGSPIF